MNFKDVYQRYGEICLACAHFKIDKDGSAGAEERIMKLLEYMPDEEHIEGTDKISVYGKCQAPYPAADGHSVTNLNDGKVSSQFCDISDPNTSKLKLFSLKID